MVIGYARGKFKEDIDEQVKNLKKFGCDRIFTEQVSVLDRGRPVFNKALNMLNRNDIFVVNKLNRVGRSISRFVLLIEGFKKDGIDFISLEDEINTQTDGGKMFLDTIKRLAQMEHDIMLEKTSEGSIRAKKSGKQLGRKRKLDELSTKKAAEFLENGISPKEVALKFNISVATLYRLFPAADIERLKAKRFI